MLAHRKDRLTQVGRALDRLGIEHIPAYSPEARGRSERMFGTLQDRLAKELKLAGITGIEAANRFIRDIYLADHNARFARPPEIAESAFVAIADPAGLAEILCIEDTRPTTETNRSGQMMCYENRTTPCATDSWPVANCRIAALLPVYPHKPFDRIDAMINLDNFSRAVRRAGMGTVLLLLVLAAPAVLVRAESEGDSLSLDYKISVAGQNVYRISYDARLSPAAYGTAIDIVPTGLGKLLSDFRLHMATRGGIASGRLEPEGFTLKSSKRREAKSLQMTWADGHLPEANRTFKLSRAGAAAIENALAPAVPDPLTAVLRHSLENPDRPCARKQRVYNGLEVYDLKITLLGKTVVDARQGGVYQGPAFKCRVVLVPIAGYPDKKMRKYLKEPPTYTVWFAPVMAPEWGNRILVPVAATGRAAGRNFSITVSSATVGGKTLAASQ
ncbi:MAG: DUF3108 domain-containing protein [Pseudomonadota bacterium]|nr:DUF3108 domain-containing protein [Pseudomonadota bacterium]